MGSDRERWDRKYASGEVPSEPAAAVRAFERYLPPGGRALDVAGGAGRHATWLATRGFDVTLVDVSPVALEIASQRSRSAALQLKVLLQDCETEPLPAGPWHLILVHHFLYRPLFQQFQESLAQGGYLLVVQPTRRNLERHARPSLRFLLEDGELPSLVPRLEIVRFDEGWTSEGRHEARLLARKPATSEPAGVSR